MGDFKLYYETSGNVVFSGHNMAAELNVYRKANFEIEIWENDGDALKRRNKKCITRFHGLSLSGSTLQLPSYWPISRSHRQGNAQSINLSFSFLSPVSRHSTLLLQTANIQ